MAGNISRENGKKGGRPKGANGALIEMARKKLIAAYVKNIKPINNALLKKAKSGDIAAIKELHDRVYGKSAQPITGDADKPLHLVFDDAFTSGTKANSGE